jgi:L-threonylcarbamoyladenylate synthase
MILTSVDARRLETCVRGGGVAIFPTDTVYGLCCDPDDERALARLYALKGRPARRAAAVMFFTREQGLAALPDLSHEARAAIEALLPGAVTLLVENPSARFAAACAEDPHTLGLRVPAWPPALAAMARVRVPVVQSSANLSGSSDARRIEEVPASVRDGVDLVLDGGELPGVPSTVVDLRGLHDGAGWRILRAGAVSEQAVGSALADARPC